MAGSMKIISWHLVQATGLGSSKPDFPYMEDESLYAGIRLHSTQYRNAELLAEQGIKVRMFIRRVSLHGTYHKSGLLIPC